MGSNNFIPSIDFISEIYVYKPEDMVLLGKLFAEILTDDEVVSLEGDLGSGKTTFVKGVGKALNVDSEIISPTFVILKDYSGEKSLYHFDFYRLSEDTQLLDIGFFDIIDFYGVKFIEWGNKFNTIKKYFDYVIRFEIVSEYLRIVRIYKTN